MLSLTQLAQRLEADDRSVWAYNVAAGFSFGDRRESGLTLGIVTDASLARVREHLRSGAELAWQLRSRGGVTYPSPDAVLSSVPADAGGPILLIEPADNIGGGAPGDGTGVLRALIAHDAKNALVALNDPQSVARLEHVPLGGLARLALGGRGWSADLGPLEVEATLLSRGSGAFRFEDPNNHLASATGSGFDMGPCAVVRAADTTVLLTSHKTPPFDLGQFRSQGIQPEHFKWIGIKAAVGHRQAYDPIAAASYYVDTPGPCSNNLALLPYRHLQRPVYPLDTVEVPTFVYR
jgi:microcystin degradation protein MlrC